MLVVLFHCGAGVPGGYVGVDVFFVISGFLITTQLVRELRETGRISLSGFYARRARRILPAATLTTIVTVIAAGLLLSPLIATAAMVFNNSTPYPGDAALLPVAAAVAIIFAGRAAGRRWGAEAVLGTKPFQRVGAWSYSWYLWHWPILILAPALLGGSLSILEALAMAVISLLIAVLSFALVERPIRRMQMFVRHPSLGLTDGAMLVASSLAAVAVARPVFASLHSGPAVARPVLVSQGTTPLVAQLSADLRAGVRTERVPSNLDPSLTAAAQDKPLIDKNGCLLVDSAVNSRGCVYGDTASHTSVVLFGDSHAAAWFPALNSVSKHQGWRLVVIAKSGCPAASVNVVRYGRLFTNCALWRRDAERQIAALHPALVVVAYSQYLHGDRPLAGVPTGYGSTWLDGTQATFSFLHRAAARAVFITDVPMLTQVAPDCVSGHLSDVRQCTVARDTGVRYPDVTRQELRLAARNHIDSIYSTPWFCTPTRCPVIVDNILMYRDAQHMTPQWSRFLTPLLANALKPVMQQHLMADAHTLRGRLHAPSA